MPPSTVIHLDHTVAELRRSPAPVASSTPSSHCRADGTLPRSSAGSKFVGCHRAKRVLNSRCRAFGTWIGRIVKTYDYINRVVIILPLTVYKGTWKTLFPLVAILHLDGSCMCVGIILKLLHSPTVASEPGLCVDVICTSRTQRSCGREYIHIACRH